MHDMEYISYTLKPSYHKGQEDGIAVSTTEKRALAPAQPNKERWKLLAFDDVDVRRSNYRAYELSVSYPARALGSAFGTRLLAKTSLKNNLGTGRPPFLVPVAIPTEANLIYLIPHTAAVSDSSIPVSYIRSSFRINLYELFKGRHLCPLADQREVYTLRMSTEPIVTPEVSGYALVLDIREKESVTVRVSELTKMRREVDELERKVRANERLLEAQAGLAAAQARLARK
jgi:hypothetical protein